jgi:hypothetical protein
MRSRFTILLGCLVLAAAACGGDDDPGPGPSGTTVKMSTVCDAISDITCDWFATCGQEIPDCVTTFRNACCSGASCNEDVAVVDDWEDCYADVLDDTSCTGDIDEDAFLECQD